MKTVLIVFHSLTGGTRQMANAAAEGARSENEVKVFLQEARETQPANLLAADGYIFATPENLAAISGIMKDFFDRTYYPVLERINARPYATLICAGSDGENAARQITRIATGWRLKPIADPLIIRTYAQTPDAILAPKTISPDGLIRCREIGASIAAGLAMGIF
jgi:multimeric flavodoxin WrbA